MSIASARPRLASLASRISSTTASPVTRSVTSPPFVSPGEPAPRGAKASLRRDDRAKSVGGCRAVDIDAYVAAHRGEWDRLEQLLRRAGRGRGRLDGAEVDELVALYQTVATHLSVVRSSTPDPALLARLCTLVARARSAVTGSSAPAWRDLARFFVVVLPGGAVPEHAVVGRRWVSRSPWSAWSSGSGWPATRTCRRPSRRRTRSASWSSTTSRTTTPRRRPARSRPRWPPTTPGWPRWPSRSGCSCCRWCGCSGRTRSTSASPAG